jgi:hypothetical protein
MNMVGRRRLNEGERESTGQAKGCLQNEIDIFIRFHFFYCNPKRNVAEQKSIKTPTPV